jgi:hypothetical protein
MPAVPILREIAACWLEFLAVQEGSRLLRGITQDSFVYYTHSFHAPVVAETTAASEYGLRFAGAVEQTTSSECSSTRKNQETWGSRS